MKSRKEVEMRGKWSVSWLRR